jgi:hypothetical protein
MEGQKGNETAKRVFSPPGFVSVNLAEGNERRSEEGGSAAFIRVSDYSCIRAFLDDLYINYLKDRFKPLTYGSNWVLETENWYNNLLLVPWSWLIDRHTIQMQENHWLHHKPLEKCGLRPGTRWMIRMVTDVVAAGLAINDERILHGVQCNPKIAYSLLIQGILKSQPMEQVSEDYQFRYVVTRLELLFHLESGAALVQSQKAIPEAEINYWLTLQHDIERGLGPVT